MTKKKQTEKSTNSDLRFRIIIEVSENTFSWGFDEKVGVEQVNIIEALGSLHYTASEILKKGKQLTK